MKDGHTKIALVGGGPAAMFIYKELLEKNLQIRVTIFEKSDRLGAGMPYSHCGAEDEHVTNVSSNEIPELPQSPLEWWTSKTKVSGNDTFVQYSPYKVFPRRLFGNYLEDQFQCLLETGKQRGLETDVFLETNVTDINYIGGKVVVTSDGHKTYMFDKVVICTGHQFPDKDEAVNGRYASPYPPRKLALRLNHPVAIRGASLTAVDAIKTLARANGEFVKKRNGKLSYHVHEDSANFRIVLHCRSGMLPSVRFHLADSHLRHSSLLTEKQIDGHRKSNGGFLSLDYIFERDFFDPLKTSSPEFYEKVKGMSMEEFVSAMLELRKRVDPFTLLKSECNEAAKSIKRRESIYWKEMLGVLSFALNYPAKYFSAEDMLRFKATLHPLISLVIAYIPQSSCAELLALHKAGCLDIVNVGTYSVVDEKADGGIIYRYTADDGSKEAQFYKTYIDCTGQPHIDLSDFPFHGLVNSGVISQARLIFRNSEAAKSYMSAHPADVEIANDGNYYLKVSGVSISDNFEVLDCRGNPNKNIYMMAVPFMGGYNPDYSGLDFCEEASKRIGESISSDEVGKEIVGLLALDNVESGVSNRKTTCKKGVFLKLL